MEFLDLVILEALRKWPSIPTATRTCTKDCYLITSDGSSLKFHRGDILHIPLAMIQNDKKFFSCPAQFDPHRFDNAKNSSHQNLLAFGIGPRCCLGANFVMHQTKVLIFAILSRYSVKPCDKTTKFSKQTTDKTLFLELTLRK